MSELTVSINETTYSTLTILAETSGETIQIILDRAIDNYRRSLFLKEANDAFASLRQNDALWQEELEERQVWDRTMLDGIAD
jgi:hypothetical protein